jgi:putative MFS transporter
VWTLPGVYLLIIGVCYFFTFFDIADIGYAMPAISKQFQLSSGESTFVALAAGLIAYAAGSMLIGSLSDRFGAVPPAADHHRYHRRRLIP